MAIVRVEGLWFLDPLAEFGDEYMSLPLSALLDPAPVGRWCPGEDSVIYLSCLINKENINSN